MSSADESEEINLKNILQQFQKVAQMSGLNNVLFGKQDKNESNLILKKVIKKEEENSLNQISMCTLFDNIKQNLLRQWEIEIV